MLPKQFLSPLDLTKAQIFYIYETTNIIMINKY